MNDLSDGRDQKLTWPPEIFLVNRKSTQSTSPVTSLDSETQRIPTNGMEETKPDELSTSAAQKLHFRVDLAGKTHPEDGKGLSRVFRGWWKAATGEEAFDWDVWRRNTLDKYGDGGFTSSTVRSNVGA
ncbi:hypothetical protein E4U43_008479 [Claviceps pusilla]|uniref:Uncharacterized protein n=1 Tax=Claviceps pusilla TaxID=123648 RepID=A0A9P7ND45_9HYPO|nr:hypothetical protein E4U43_008479 [Claviceps pusilla]